MTRKGIDDLAFFGGAPAFRVPLHVGRPNIGDRTVLFQRLNDLLDRRWLTNYGPYVQEFERLIAAQVGARHCIAVCNATIALQAVARALGLHDEVILPSFTFIASAHALKWLGITPIFCDIDPGTHNIDPVDLQKHISPRTSGVMGVHVWGRGCDVTALQEIADRHDLSLFFDAAHGFGCSYQGQMIGNFGQAEVFSFHATKFVNSFEGGAVVTNQDHLAEKVRWMINFGFRGYDNVISLGTNGKMSEISAAMGITSLESMDQFISKNYANYCLYHQVFDGLPGVKIITYDKREKNNYQYIVVEIDQQTTGIDRDLLFKILLAENILARRYFYPGCHAMEPYRADASASQHVLPETEKLSSKVLVFPNGTALEDDDIYTIGDIMNVVITNSGQIVDRLRL